MFSYEDCRCNSPQEIREKKNNVFLRGICFRKSLLLFPISFLLSENINRHNLFLLSEHCRL